MLDFSASSSCPCFLPPLLSSSVPSPPLPLPPPDAALEQQIILHEDKKYYPSAEEVYGSEAEIVIAEEDTQALETPIIAPQKTKTFQSLEKSMPETSFDYNFMAGLMDHPQFVRHVAFAGQLHHGKTSLVDLMVHQTHPSLPVPAGKTMRYTDARFDEQERGLSIKTTPMSFVLPDLRAKSLLVNVLDTPGHVNFSDEQTAAFRLVDGVVLVVDAVEGVMMQTERSIRHAVAEGLHVMVVINKVDRLILELKLPPQDAYHKIVHTLEEINAVLTKCDYFLPIPDENAQAASSSSAAAASAASSSAAPAASATRIRPRLSPEHNNVCFASALHGWVFSCFSFAKIYSDYHQSFDYTQLGKRLWGNMYLHSDRKFRAKPDTASGQNASTSRSFIQFILEPLYKIYSYVLGNEGEELEKILRVELGVRLKKEQLNLDSKPLLRLVCSSFFGDCAAMVEMIKQHVPDPRRNASRKVRQSYTGDLVGELGRSLLACDPRGVLMLHCSKNIPRADGSSFDNLGRVFSGSVKVGDRVRVLGENYSVDDDEDASIREISRIWILQGGRYRVEVNRVTAGNIALFEGMDGGITKTGTVTTPREINPQAATAAIFRPLQFNTCSVFKVALEPLNPAELPKMLEGLRKLDKSYPLAVTKVEESGEHVLMGTGELYMDCMLHDIRKMYGFGSVATSSSGGAAAAAGSATTAPLNSGAEIEIKISDPQVRFCETVLETSSLQCFAETPNRANKLTMIAEPLEGGIAEDLERGTVRMDMDPKSRAEFFTKKYNWDLLSARSLWSFGPEAQGPNLLVDHTLPGEVDKKKLWSVRESVVQGFQWGTREGPLCDEPIRNVKFKLLHASIADDPILRARGQLIPTARRVCYSSFLLATPRLMEPVYFVEIQSPADCVSAIYNVLSRRRGHVTSSLPKAGTPLYTVQAYIPLIESFGFETDLRTHTQGLAFCMSVFDHWEIVPGDPLDKSIILRPLEPAPIDALAREFMVKTRRRKGLSEEVSVTKFFDQSMIEQMARQELEGGDMQL